MLWVQLTGNAIRLHFEVGDVVSRPIALSAHATSPWPDAGEASSGMNLIGDGLQVTEGRTVLRLGLGEFCLPVIHLPLELLHEEWTQNIMHSVTHYVLFTKTLDHLSKIMIFLNVDRR